MEQLFNEIDQLLSVIIKFSETDVRPQSASDHQMLYYCAKHLSNAGILALSTSAKFLEAAGVDTATFRETIIDMNNAVEEL
jgi:hypothetical protein